MRKLYMTIAAFVLATLFTGCSWYVPYPSVGVRAKIKPTWIVTTKCYRVHVGPQIKIRCRDVRVRVR